MGLSVGAPCVECVNFGEWETCASPAQATPDSPWLLVRMARGNEQRRLSNGQFIDRQEREQILERVRRPTVGCLNLTDMQILQYFCRLTWLLWSQAADQYTVADQHAVIMGGKGHLFRRHPKAFQ